MTRSPALQHTGGGGRWVVPGAVLALVVTSVLVVVGTAWTDRWQGGEPGVVLTPSSAGGLATSAAPTLRPTAVQPTPFFSASAPPRPTTRNPPASGASSSPTREPSGTGSPHRRGDGSGTGSGSSGTKGGR